MAPRWSESDDQRLLYYWGNQPLPVLARLLGRTEAAVEQHALAVGLRSVRDAFLTLTEASRRAGWDASALRRAARALRLDLPLRPTTARTRAHGRTGRGRALAISEETLEQLTAWLEIHGQQRG